MKAKGNEQSIENGAKCSQNNLDNFAKKIQKHFSNEMKIHFFIEDPHLPPNISK
jgi:hypothetical protein